MVLAVVVLLAGVALVPLGRAAPAAFAQVLPSPTDSGGLLEGILHPSPSPSPSDEPGSGGGSGGGSGDGRSSGGPGGSGGDGGSQGSSEGVSRAGGPAGGATGHARGSAEALRHGGGRKAGGRSGGRAGGFFAPSGSYSDERLVALATRLRSLGLSQQEIIERVYVPFILAGPAAWTDTWHAPRYGPAPGEIRQHEGQDVFCNEGDPVLATRTGWVNYSDYGLGGIVARVHLDDGTYFYYAHLTATNAGEHPAGTTVHPGDVIGYCGNTGDAAGGPTHVHFGWYEEGGTVAMNPMHLLVRWLHRAERRALGTIVEARGRRLLRLPALISARRFGIGFTPDAVELGLGSDEIAVKDVLRNALHAGSGEIGIPGMPSPGLLDLIDPALLSKSAAGIEEAEAAAPASGKGRAAARRRS